MWNLPYFFWPWPETRSYPRFLCFFHAKAGQKINNVRTDGAGKRRGSSCWCGSQQCEQEKILIDGHSQAARTVRCRKLPGCSRDIMEISAMVAGCHRQEKEVITGSENAFTHIISYVYSGQVTRWCWMRETVARGQKQLLTCQGHPGRDNRIWSLDRGILPLWIPEQKRQFEAMD